MTSHGFDAVGPDLVTVRTFTSESEAEVAKAALEAFGIQCMLRRDDCGGQRPHLLIGAGIRLLIRSNDSDRVEDVLRSQAEDSS